MKQRSATMNGEGIEKALRLCQSGDLETCEDCPYHGRGCELRLTKDTIRYIEELKEEIAELKALVALLKETVAIRKDK